MRLRQLIPLLAICALVILAVSSPQLAHAQEFVQYRVQLNADGSSLWTITQASSLNGTIDTWRGFQQKVNDLVYSAANQTQREMGFDPNSLQLNTIWENQSETTQYQFMWLNSSALQNSHIVFGDIFRVNGFFSQLYGDGELQIIYPQNYTVSSVSPQPNGGNNAPETLDWLGTDFFINGNPSVLLVPLTPSPSPTQTNGIGASFYVAIGSSLAATAIVFLVGIYVLRRRRNNKNVSLTSIPPMVPIVESEEEKILKTLQANGGSVFQSAIKDECHFSKSKTSQLLTSLEKRGIVRRYKKGRDKIVTLLDQTKVKGDLS